jgi:peptide/nickel transport system permease protein
MADSSAGRVAERKRHSFLVDSMIRLMREKPLGMVGGVITLLLLLTGIFADFLAPYGMNETHTADALAASSARFWLGTDNLGRDLLTRVIFGARISVVVGLTASAIATILSLIIGILCGYIGGKLDLVVQRFVDAAMCFPGLVLLMVLISMIGPGLWQIIIVMGIRTGIVGSRIVRGATIGVREDVYVQAAEAIGCSTTRILTRHILPNIMAPIIILFTTRVPDMILTEASLSFLGFGIPPPGSQLGRYAQRQWAQIHVHGPLDGDMARPCPEYRGIWYKYVWRCIERYTGPEVKGWYWALRGESEKRS